MTSYERARPRGAADQRSREQRLSDGRAAMLRVGLTGEHEPAVKQWTPYFGFFTADTIGILVSLTSLTLALTASSPISHVAPGVGFAGIALMVWGGIATVTLPLTVAASTGYILERVGAQRLRPMPFVAGVFAGLAALLYGVSTIFKVMLNPHDYSSSHAWIRALEMDVRVIGFAALCGLVTGLLLILVTGLLLIVPVYPAGYEGGFSDPK